MTAKSENPPAFPETERQLIKSYNLAIAMLEDAHGIPTLRKRVRQLQARQRSAMLNERTKTNG
jgi:hypothetical protein